ncbi:MAG: 30S ribosomal protein S6 [Deltaproteobacteria bacterium]|nr:30S ribosomal protein S6 [Deltaproteobacteria bacterium]
MRHYETIYIVNPNLADEEYKEAVKKFNSLVEKKKGIIIKVQEWGKQRLAYEVKKFDKGSYVMMDYCGETEITAELERDLKLDDRVLMCQTIKLANKVDPQELILKAKEAEKESVAKEAQVLEKTAAVQNKEKAQVEEVKNGVS